MASALAADSAVRVTTDVASLAAGRAEKPDVCLPAPPAAGKLSPVVVWIHGGGWTGGTKGEARAKEICPPLANAGYHYSVTCLANLADEKVSPIG